MIADVLRDTGACDDPAPLLQAAALCATNKPKGPKSWGYAVSDLQFRLAGLDNPFPANIYDPSVTLSVLVEGIFGDSESHDPFTMLAVDIVISARRGLTGSGAELLSCWHLDRHLEGEQVQGAVDVHPLYHFQHGGHRIKHLADDLGRGLITPVPRLLHPPMDALISIDVLLANFTVKYWRAVRADARYSRRIMEAYRTYWTPFFAMLGTDSPHSRAQVLRLCPLFAVSVS